ncbi:MAG: MBL fold metallo-hydrolase [Acidobacteria bacterium]|nr:MBL fold metallo-hydrolase [Acidobacteriota bacterium]
MGIRMKIHRRHFLAGLAAPMLAQSQESLPPWKPGTLDIHHISTGRGNCTLTIAPDGTVLMIDAGAQMPTEQQLVYYVPAYPDLTRRPGEWMARYAQRHLAKAGLEGIDHLWVTHFHSDHMGECKSDLPQSKKGSWKLTGVMDIAEQLRIGKIVDRGYPNYSYPAPLNDATMMNYQAFAKDSGLKLEAFRSGSNTQLGAVQKPQEFANFEVRNIVANGELWTGQGTATRQTFPSLAGLKPKDYPSENMCSGGIRIRYGAFDYFHGGDLCDGSNYGLPAWRNIESAAARVVGPVDVALASHHGYSDSTAPAVVRALRPRAFIIHSWDSAHPTMPALHNMLSEELYPGPRDIFATALKAEAKVAIRRLNQLKSALGHVVVRVQPGGASYEVLITTNADESDRVTARFGPYQSA